MGRTPQGVTYVSTAEEAVLMLKTYLRRLAVAEANESVILAGKFRAQVTMWSGVVQALTMAEERAEK